MDVGRAGRRCAASRGARARPVAGASAGTRLTAGTPRRHPPPSGLRPGNQLQRPGSTAVVTAIRLFHATATTYDLTIAGLHTYYVDAGTTPVLVHNCTKPQGVYSFSDLWNPGQTYVGKTMDFGERLAKWVKRGRLSQVEDADCLHVCGTEDDVFAAEDEMITRLKSQGVPLSNQIASPGRAIINQRQYVQLPLW